MKAYVRDLMHRSSYWWDIFVILRVNELKGWFVVQDPAWRIR